MIQAVFLLVPAAAHHRKVISQLMQFYIYDFSEFLDMDVGEHGSFENYPHLEHYWEEPSKRFAYVIMKDEKYAGFVLLRWMESQEQKYFSVAEFFVMKKYRRQGTGTGVAKQLFNLHRGRWEVFQKESNKPARFFWRKVIAAYTNGKFTERFDDGRWIQNFENSL